MADEKDKKPEDKKEDKKEADPKTAKEGDTPQEGEAPAEGGEAPPRKSKKKLIIIVAVVLLVLGGGGAGLFFSGILGGKGDSEEVDPNLVAQTVYYDLDEFLVNLNNPGRQVSFLKMTVTLELPNLATKSVVESKLPRVRDSFQVYLRELRSSDLQGSAGIQRLREELMLRINKVLEPEKVTDILFKEVIVQ